MTITPRNGDLNAGVPTAEYETFEAQGLTIFTGDIPHPLPVEEIVKTGEILALYTVVGLDANGELVAADNGATADAIGVLATDLSVAAVAGQPAVVWRAGVFDPSLLVWDAAYSTDALKRAAFEGAPSPTQVVLRGRQNLDMVTGL